MDKLSTEIKRMVKEKGIQLAENEIDDVLIVALFPQVGLKFLENRGNPNAFEPVPTNEVKTSEKPTALSSRNDSAVYTVEVEGKSFVVKVTEGGDISHITPVPTAPSTQSTEPATSATTKNIPVNAPMAGNIWKVLVKEGQQVAEGEVLLILEAMKMETEIRAATSGTVQGIKVKAGDTVAVGDILLTLA